MAIIVILGDFERPLYNDHWIHFYEKNKLTFMLISTQVNNLKIIGLESIPTILLKTAENDAGVPELTSCYFYIIFLNWA